MYLSITKTNHISRTQADFFFESSPIRSKDVAILSRALFTCCSTFRPILSQSVFCNRRTLRSISLFHIFLTLSETRVELGHLTRLPTLVDGFVTGVSVDPEVCELRAFSNRRRSFRSFVWKSFAMTVIVVMLRYVIVVTINSPPMKGHPFAMAGVGCLDGGWRR